MTRELHELIEVAYALVGTPCEWTLAQATPIADVNGAPVFRFKKQLIRIGDYVKESDNLEFSITQSTLRHWVATFQAMQENGVEVPVPLGHSFDALQNRGYLRGLSIEGDFLVGLIDLIGKDAVELAARNDVSLYVPASFTDGKGKRYVRPIIHVALTPYPVVPGLGDFQAVAASFVKEKAKMDWTKIREALGIKAELKDENAEALLLAAFEEAKKPVTPATTPEPKPTVELSPVVLELAIDNRKLKLGQLVDARRITPATRDKLVALFTKKETLALSLTNGDSFNELVAVLADNDVLPLKGEQTGPQTPVALSNAATQDGKDPLVEDAKRRAEAAKSRN